MNLYEMTGAYAHLQAALEYGATTPEEEAEILEAMEAISDNFDHKADGYARIIRNMTAKIEALEAEEKRLYARRATLKKGVERLKASLYDGMVTLGKRKVDTGIGRWSIAKNPISVQVHSTAAIPDEYWKPSEPTLDRRALLEDMKQGLIVEGCELVQTEGIRFR